MNRRQFLAATAVLPALEVPPLGMQPATTLRSMQEDSCPQIRVGEDLTCFCDWGDELGRADYTVCGPFDCPPVGGWVLPPSGGWTAQAWEAHLEKMLADWTQGWSRNGVYVALLRMPQHLEINRYYQVVWRFVEPGSNPPEGWRIDAVYKDMPKSSEESDLDVGV